MQKYAAEYNLISNQCKLNDKITNKYLNYAEAEANRKKKQSSLPL